MSAQAVMLITAMLTVMPVTAEQRCAAAASPSGSGSPSERFTDGGDGTVTDARSKLMWMRCSSGQALTDAACRGQPRSLNWAKAQAFAGEVNASGELFFKDWRLPHVQELAALADRRCDHPRIDLAVFPNTPPAAYWTASARPPESPGFAYALSFGAEGVKLIDKERQALVRLVRSAR